MKRYFFVLLSLCVTLSALAGSVTSLSDLVGTKSYYVRVGDRGYLYAQAGKAYADASAAPTTNDAYRWAVVYNEKAEAYFLYNLKDSTFLTAADGACPLTEAASPVYLLAATDAQSWYVYTAGSVIGLASNSEGDVLLQSESATQPDAFSFEEAGDLSEAHITKIQAAVWLSVTQAATVPVISSIGTRITALSDLVDGNAYLLYSTGFSKYAYDEGSALTFGSSAPARNNITAMPYVFTFHKAGSQWVIETGIEGNYISGLSSSNVLTGTEPTTFTITASSTTGSFNLYSSASSQYINAQSAKPVGWGESEGNSRYQLIPVTLTNSERYYPITYICYETDGEVTRLMDIQTYAKTTNRVTPPTFTGYKRLTTKAADGESTAPSVVSEPTVVCVTYERNLRSQPVVPTTINGTAFADTTRWYTLQVGGRYMQVQREADGHYMLNNTSLNQLTDDALWCFVGNNVEGYRLYNRAAGADFSLSLAGEPQSTDLPFIKDGLFEHWAISNGSQAGTWYVSPVGTKNVVYLGDDSQHKLSVMDATTAVIISEAAEVMTEYAATVAANMGTAVGQYPITDAHELVAAADDYTLTEAAFDNLRQAYNAFRQETSPVAIVRDQLYRIVANDGTVLTADVDAATATVAAKTDDARAALWRLLPVGSTGSYYVLNPENGGFLGVTSGTRQATVVAAPGNHSYALANFSTDLAQWTLRDNGTSGSTGYLNLSTSGTPTGGRNTDVAASWRIEPIEAFVVNTEGVGDACVATVFLPFDAQVPEDLVAAIISEKTSDAVTIEPLTSRVIPAETPVLLISATPGRFVLTPAESASDAVADNLLVGVAKRTTVGSEGAPAAGEAYVLSQTSTFVSAESALPAYTAYLTRDEAEAAALAILLPTAIDQIRITEGNTGTWYDLQGRPTSTPTQPGVFIHNGKKIVVK